MTAAQTTGVLDASALIAFLRLEPGAEVVRATLRTGAVMSAVNVSEALATLATLDRSADEVFTHLKSTLFGDMLQIVPFDAQFALATAQLRPLTLQHGLSLGDRACLALALHRHAPALTTDRLWADVASDVGVIVRLIRP